MASKHDMQSKNRDGIYAVILIALPVVFSLLLTMFPIFESLMIEFAGSQNFKVPLLNVFLVLISMEILGLFLGAKMIFHFYRKR